MIEIPTPYSTHRAAAACGEVAYGVGGIELYDLTDLESAQTGYSVDSSGRSLAGTGPGEWRAHWIVIGHETACGDPLFISAHWPHPVYSATHGEGAWNASLVAPSVESFFGCIDVFRRFAQHRSNPAERDTNPPSDEEIQGYLDKIQRLCERDADALGFWAVEAEIGMNDEEWSLRLEQLLNSRSTDSDKRS